MIVPLKLGLKFSYSSDLKHCVVWLSHTSSHSGCARGGGVIVPLKLGLKFSYSSDLKHCVVWAEIFL